MTAEGFWAGEGRVFCYCAFRRPDWQWYAGRPAKPESEGRNPVSRHVLTPGVRLWTQRRCRKWVWGGWTEIRDVAKKWAPADCWLEVGNGVRGSSKRCSERLVLSKKATLTMCLLEMMMNSVQDVEFEEIVYYIKEKYPSGNWCSTKDQDLRLIPQSHLLRSSKWAINKRGEERNSIIECPSRPGTPWETSWTTAFYDSINFLSSQHRLV